MKKGLLLIVMVLLNCYVGALPRGNPCYSRIFIPTNWKVKENVMCPHGYVCYHDMWAPSITVHYPVWVFGVSNQEKCGGIIKFRKYPDEPCTKNCVQDIPVLYTAEVIYVSPYEQPVYTPEEVPLTYIPPGVYVVTSPDFVMYHNIRIWHFADEGGPKKMHVDFKADKPKYGRKDATAVLTVEVTDDSGAYIKVDSISGVITLPDNTQKTVDPKDWLWNSDDDLYEYHWNFANDDGICADPKEGTYTAEVYVKKKYYEDVKAVTSFGVCYHVAIDLTFDKNPPDYSIGEPVEMIVCITDEDGCPVRGDVESILLLPDGTVVTDLEWTQTDPGIYVTSYLPQQEGVYHITVGITQYRRCFLEEASGTFYGGCTKPYIQLEINSDSIIEEPVEFVLTVTDSEGNPLLGGEIESELCILDETPYPVFLSWTDHKDGTYTTEYTPSTPGYYYLSGTVTIIGESTCFRGDFEGHFTITESNLPDLQIRNEDITVYPDPEIENEVTIFVTVRNIGDADAGKFCVTVLLNGKVLESTIVEELAAGESITLEFTWDVKYSGKYVIAAVADSGQCEAEVKV